MGTVWYSPTDETSTSEPKDLDLESDLTLQPLIKFKNGEYSRVKVDDDGIPETHSNGEYIFIKGVDPTTLTGRTIKCKQDDGIILRARVDACLNQYDKLCDQIFKVVYDDTYHSYLSTEKVDELMRRMITHVRCTICYLTVI